LRATQYDPTTAAFGIPLIKKERNLPAANLKYDGEGRLLAVRDGVATPVLDSSGQPVVNESERLVNYRGFRVPQTNAAAATAQEGRLEQQQANRDEDRSIADERYTAEQQRREVERQHDKYAQERGRAAELAREFERAKATSIEAAGQVQYYEQRSAATASDPAANKQAMEALAAARQTLNAASTQARGLLSQLRGSYGRHYETGTDAAGNPYIKPLPSPEFKPLNIPPPRRAVPRTGGGNYTEREVRERARQRGVNEEDAVRAAKDRGLIRLFRAAPASPYAGSTIKRANVAVWGAGRGLTPQQAEARLRAEGIEIVD